MIKNLFAFGKMVTSLFLVISIIALPLLAQQAETQNAVREAEQQAKIDAKGTTWLIIGCLSLLVGLVISQVIEPKPPQSALIGKSPEYVAAYTDAYIRKVKSIRTNNALIGCGIGTAVSVGFYVLLIAAAVEETSNYY